MFGCVAIGLLAMEFVGADCRLMVGWVGCDLCGCCEGGFVHGCWDCYVGGSSLRWVFGGW